MANTSPARVSGTQGMEHMADDEDEYSFVEESNKAGVDEVPLEIEKPSVQADMSFPSKSWEEVRPARGLWRKETIMITYSGGNGVGRQEVYISRDLICSSSKTIRQRFPEERSWPILTWESICSQGWATKSTWYLLADYMTFLHTDTKKRGADGCYGLDSVDGWCLGWLLGCDMYQDACMMDMMRINAETQDHFSVQKRVEGTLAAINKMKIDFAGKITYYFHTRLFKYIFDLLIWDSANGGSTWLDVVIDGGYFAYQVAQTQVEAAKEPPPRFPPWHFFNCHKYLINAEKSDPNGTIMRKVQMILDRGGDVADPREYQTNHVQE